MKPRKHLCYLSLILFAASLKCYAATNHALGKSVTASGYTNSNYPSNAVDGEVSDSSRWLANDSNGNHWLEIDLISDVSLVQAHVYSGYEELSGSPIGNVTLEYWNGIAWLPIPGANLNNNSDFAVKIVFDNSVTTSKVRFKSSDTGYIRLREIALWDANAALGSGLTGSELPVTRSSLTVNSVFNISEGDTEIISGNVQVSGSSDGRLVMSGGDLVVGGSVNLGTNGDFRDGILEYEWGITEIEGNLNFSNNYSSGTVCRLRNPGQGVIEVEGDLYLGRVLLSLVFDDDYVHQTGQSFPVITYTNRIGLFENVHEGEILAYDRYRFEVHYDVPVGDEKKGIQLTALESYPQSNGPNIVFIMVDAQGYNELGAYGAASKFPTPNIDGLATNGVLFTDAYSPSPVCSPTRGSLISGKYPQSVGYRQNSDSTNSWQGISPAIRTFPQRMQAVGYRNYYVGKWYTGNSAPREPLQRGYHQYYGLSGSGVRYLPGSYNLIENETEKGTSSKYLTDEMGDKAVDYITSHHAQYPNQPFLLFLSFYAPHSPFQGDPNRISYLENQGYSYANNTQKNIAAMNLAVDDNVGKITNCLNNLGLTEDTLIVYTNDNGGTGNHLNGVLRGNKGNLWEGGIRVPCIAQWPNQLSAGAVYEEPIHLMDWVATFCNVGGLPNRELNELDGLNLLPFLRRERDYPHDRALFWNLWPRDFPCGAIRLGDWKLHVSDDLEQVELYNLSSDIGEQTDVQAQNPEKTQELYDRYVAWQRTHVMPTWEENWNPGIMTMDNGLFCRSIVNGYRLSNRTSSAKYYTSEARPVFDLSSDFALFISMSLTEAASLNSNSAGYVVFGPSDNRNSLIRVGMHYGTQQLVIDELATGRSASVVLPESISPVEPLVLCLKYTSIDNRLRLEYGTTYVDLVISSSTDWNTMGFGVTSSEVEIRITREREESQKMDVQFIDRGQDSYKLDLSINQPNGLSPKVFGSEDLVTFTEDHELLLERMDAGRFHVTVPIPEDKRFYRFGESLE